MSKMTLVVTVTLQYVLIHAAQNSESLDVLPFLLRTLRDSPLTFQSTAPEQSVIRWRSDGF